MVRTRVTVLETPQRRVERSLVEMIEDLLVMAKSGELMAAAAAVVYADGHTGTFASENECAAKQIGAAAILVQELAANAINAGHDITERPKPPIPA